MMECILWTLGVVPDEQTLLIPGSERTVVCIVLPVIKQVKIANATLAIRNIRNCSNFIEKCAKIVVIDTQRYEANSRGIKKHRPIDSLCLEFDSVSTKANSV